jgi:hypothetical protein
MTTARAAFRAVDLMGDLEKDGRTEGRKDGKTFN